MVEFSSTQFLNVYLNGRNPPSVSATMLDKVHNNTGVELIDLMRLCVEYVNNHDGFTIVGWYKHGLIEDKSLITLTNKNNGFNQEENQQVQAGDICYHIVSIMPSNCDLLNKQTPLGIGLAALQFNVRSISM